MPKHRKAIPTTPQAPAATSLESAIPTRPGTSPRVWLYTLCALFLARAAAWAMEELWYDEILSLNLFVMRPDSIFAVFRDYRIANNHFLANAVQWLWCRIFPAVPGSELFLRVPSLLFGLGTLLVIACYWKKWLGKKFALVTAFLMAASPVFVAFAYQMRGYSLAMFLSTLAVTAAYARKEAPTAKNGIALFLTSLALPLVMPSAAMLPMAICASFALPWILREKDASLKALLQRVWPCAAGAFLGVAYYLTLWAEFQRARRESGGWESAWMVAAHLLLAFGLHLALYAWPLSKKALKNSAVRSMLFGVLAAIAAVLILPSAVGRAPFPRVFLPLLPMLTMAAAIAAKDFPKLDDMPLKKLISLAILPGLFLGIATDYLNSYLLDNYDTPPQNLLVQYYRGQSPNRLWTSLILERKTELLEVEKYDIALLNPTDEPAFRFYKQFVDIPEEEKTIAFFPANFNLQESPIRNYAPHLVIYARNENEARNTLETQGIPRDTPLAFSERREHRTLYRLAPLDTPVP